MNKTKFKTQLKKATGCDMQYNGWTCGTCFFSLNAVYKLKGKNQLTNLDWRSLLLFRGDYTNEDLKICPEKYARSINKIWNLIKED